MPRKMKIVVMLILLLQLALSDVDFEADDLFLYLEWFLAVTLELGL